MPRELPLAPRLAIGNVDRALRQQRARVANLPFTYPDVGAALAGRTPSGYVPIDTAAVVGAGTQQFQALADAIRRWEVHRHSGLRVDADGTADEGDVVVLASMFGPVGVMVPCRVVGVVDEPRRKGFAYGTLPGHPESGEEAFVVDLSDDDAVAFRVFGFSRAGTLATAAAAPLTRIITRHALAAYLKAAHEIAQR